MSSFLFCLFIYFVLDSTCKKNCMIFAFVWLTSLSIISSLFRLFQMLRFHSFLWQSNNPLYHMHHVFFMKSSIYGHLGHFHILSIIHNAAMNIGEHVSFKLMFCISLDKYPEWNCLRNFHTVSIVAAPIYNSTNSAQEFHFLHILANNKRYCNLKILRKWRDRPWPFLFVRGSPCRNKEQRMTCKKYQHSLPPCHRLDSIPPAAYSQNQGNQC